MVSRAWSDALRSRKVYDARAQAHSTERFVFGSRDRLGNALWSTRENYLVRVPPINHCGRHLVACDGRIYLLGRIGKTPIRDEVYVADVAAGETRRWRKCARMIELRRDFGCAVIDGKIYVCGGEKEERSYIEYCGSEVYNPNEDLWSPIKPMPERYYHRAKAVGEELFVHKRDDQFEKDASSDLNVYHPGKDEWRVVSPFDRSRSVLFVARGKLHSIDKSGIDFYNAEENSWTELHSFSSIDQDRYVVMDKWAAFVHLDDEVLIKYWVGGGRRNRYGQYKGTVCLAKSNGFGSDNTQIVWQKVPLTKSLENLLEDTRELTSILL